MPLIEWNEKLSTGIFEIDIQHKKWIEMVNRLYDEMSERKASEQTVKNIIDELIDYINVHFSFEQKYFKEFNYKDTSKHIEEHNKLIKFVEDLKTQYKPGNKTLAVTILPFVADWVTNHILKSDKEYRDFFIGKGLK